MSHRPNLVTFLQESASAELHLVLRGHLHLEAVLDATLDRALKDPQALGQLGLTFARKVHLLKALGRLDEKAVKVLLAFNSLRNKVAHRIQFRVSFDDAFELVRIAAAAGVDFSDEDIFRDKQKSANSYGIEGILWEVITNVFQELILSNGDLFSQDEIGDFLG